MVGKYDNAGTKSKEEPSSAQWQSCVNATARPLVWKDGSSLRLFSHQAAKQWTVRATKHGAFKVGFFPSPAWLFPESKGSTFCLSSWGSYFYVSSKDFSLTLTVWVKITTEYNQDETESCCQSSEENILGLSVCCHSFEGNILWASCCGDRFWYSRSARFWWTQSPKWHPQPRNFSSHPKKVLWQDKR